MDVSLIINSAISGLIIVFVSHAFQWVWGSIKKSNSINPISARKAGTMMLSILRDLAVMWFLLFQLSASITSPEPLTRWSAFWIAFWTWWALFYLAAMLGLGIKREER